MTQLPAGPPRAIVLHPNDGCLTIARALVRRGVPVHMLATETTSYMLASRGVTGRVVPDPRTGADVWIAELEELAASGGGVVICGSDAASEFVSAHRKELPESLRTFESTDGVHTLLMDKRRLYELAASIGVRAPWMHHVVTTSDLDALLDELTYPCVLKGALGHRARGVLGHGTVLVHDRPQLLDLGGRLLDEDVDFLLSELVPGEESALEGAVTVRCPDGSYALEYGRRKVRQWPLDYGVGSLTTSHPVPETFAMNRTILDHTGFVGISSCETKRHAGTGELYLIEINVRVPGSFGVAEASGVDGSWRLYASAAGIALAPQPRQRDGRSAMLPEMELQAAAARVRARQQTPGTVLRTWASTRDFGVLSLRDPAPAATLLWTMVRRRSTRIARERWARLRGRHLIG